MLAFLFYKLLAGNSAACLSASLFAGLLVVRVLFELAKNATLLELHVKSLKCAIDRFVILNGDVNQTASGLRAVIMAQLGANLSE